jgi:SAM-dependent methyltransferase
MKIQLGCENDYKQGYINIDKSPSVNPDVVWDLEKQPLPFADNSVDEVLANAIVEHINNFVPLMHELHRICKPGAKIHIMTSFYSAWGQYNDPTHVRFFGVHTFDYFKKGIYSHEVGCDKDMFDCKVRLVYAYGRAKILNAIMNPIININIDFYSRFLAFILPVSGIEYDLVVIK